MSEKPCLNGNPAPVPVIESPTLNPNTGCGSQGSFGSRGPPGTWHRFNRNLRSLFGGRKGGETHQRSTASAASAAWAIQQHQRNAKSNFPGVFPIPAPLTLWHVGAYLQGNGIEWNGRNRIFFRNWKTCKNTVNDASHKVWTLRAWAPDGHADHLVLCHYQIEWYNCTTHKILSKG